MTKKVPKKVPKRAPTCSKVFFLKFWTKIQKSYWIWGFWKKKSRPPTSPKFQTHKKIFLHIFTPIRFLFKICPKTYKSFIQIKDPKITSLHFFTFHFHFTTRLGTFKGFCTERARLGTLKKKSQNFEILTQNEHLPAQRFFF